MDVVFAITNFENSIVKCPIRSTTAYLISIYSIFSKSLTIITLSVVLSSVS